jgi:hypothetical protein
MPALHIQSEINAIRRITDPGVERATAYDQLMQRCVQAVQAATDLGQKDRLAMLARHVSRC